MCLAIPGKILSINESVSETKMAKVSFSGIIKEVCIDFTPDVQVGDYVIVHVGFAINKLDEEEALETLKLISELEKAGSQ